MIDAKFALVSVWSYGLAGVLAAIVTLYLASGWQTGGRGRAMCLAAGLSALWGVLGLGYALTGNKIFLSASLLSDALRYGAWFLFLLVLMKPEGTERDASPGRYGWLSRIAPLLVAVGIGAQILVGLGLDFVLPSARMALFSSLAMSVFGLVLIEQLFRNVSPDFRWSIKPLCLGLGAAFLYDLYLYSDALLFTKVDVDAFSIRGFAHALGLPLMALSAIRSNGWKRKMVISKQVAMQSATLVIVGVYLLFMASAGY